MDRVRKGKQTGSNFIFSKFVILQAWNFHLLLDEGDDDDKNDNRGSGDNDMVFGLYSLWCELVVGKYPLL